MYICVYFYTSIFVYMYICILANPVSRCRLKRKKIRVFIECAIAPLHKRSKTVSAGLRAHNFSRVSRSQCSFATLKASEGDNLTTPPPQSLLYKPMESKIDLIQAANPSWRQQTPEYFSGSSWRYFVKNICRRVALLRP